MWLCASWFHDLVLLINDPSVRKPCTTHGYVLYYGRLRAFHFPSSPELTPQRRPMPLSDDMLHMVSYCAWSDWVSVWSGKWQQQFQGRVSVWNTLRWTKCVDCSWLLGPNCCFLMVKLLDVAQPSQGEARLVLCHSVLDQRSPLFTRDTHTHIHTHTDSSQVSVVWESNNTEKKTISSPDLNLVWAASSSSVAWVSSLIDLVWPEQLRRPPACFPALSVWFAAGAALRCLHEFSDHLKKHSSGWCLSLFFFFPHVSPGLRRTVDSRAAIGREGGREGGKKKGVRGCLRWGSAAHPRLGHQSRSVACRCTF